MVIAIIALPPPVSGQAVAGRILLDHLTAEGRQLHIINISRSLTLVSNVLRAARVIQQFLLPVRLIWKRFRTRASLVTLYLQAGQSAASMMRDLPLLIVARLLRMRIVLHLHGGTYCQELDRLPRLFRRSMLRNLKRVDHVIALSPCLAKPLIQRGIGQNVHQVPNGVTDDVLRDALARAPREMRVGPLRVLFLANLMPEKGYADAVEAAKICHSLGYQHTFVFAGEPASYSSHMSPDVMQDLTPNACHVGAVHGRKKLQLLAESDVLLLPSRREGQPLAILEAMHYGLAVVTTPVGGIPDIVSHKVNGFLVAPGRPEQIAQSIQDLSTSPQLRAAIRRRNQEAARTKYSGSQHGAAVSSILFDGVAVQAP